MLERLFTSKTRVKVLEELLLNPESEYHIRELSRIVVGTPTYVQKELKNLESLGLLKSRKQGNLVLYKLDKGSSIIEDLKRIFLKTESIGDWILMGLADKERIRYAFIYGSFAKGTAATKSDIDLLVIGNVDEDSVLRSVSKTEKRIGREINYILWTEREFAHKVREKIPLLRELSKTPLIMIVGKEDELKRAIEKGSS